MRITLLNSVARVLMDKVLAKFQEEIGSGSARINQGMNTQEFYGFGESRDSRHSLKHFLSAFTPKKVSGKQIYLLAQKVNKREDIVLGRAPYTTVFFKALGHTDVFDFLEKTPELSPSLVARQKDSLFEDRTEAYTPFAIEQSMLDHRLRDITGSYWVFYPNSFDGVSQSILEIEDDASFSLTTRLSDERKVEFEGRTDRFSDGNVYLAFTDRGNYIPPQYLVLYIGSVPGGRNFFGVLNKSNSAGVPVGVNVVCVKAREGEVLEPRHINSKSPEFKKIDSNYNGVGSFLLGRERNYLTSHRSQRLGSVDQSTRVGRAFFYSAVFLDIKHPGSQKAKEELKKAYSNGFRSLVVISSVLRENDQELSESFKACLSNFIDSISPDADNSAPLF